MTKAKPIPASEEAWDTRALGAEEHHSVASQRTDGKELDEALDLQLISIRLPKALIEDLKFIADREGLKYQPLVRKLLVRFVDSEMKMIARSATADAKRKEAAEEDDAEPPAVRRRA